MSSVEDEASWGQSVGGENDGDNVVEGSRGFHIIDGQREYGGGGPAMHGIQDHFCRMI